MMNFDRKMDEAARHKMQTISVLVEGRICYQKVTKNTTCGDIIKYLLNYSRLTENDKDSYFLYASNNITEQQLSNKANILKVAKDLMSGTNRVHFVLRKKTRLFVPKISIAKRRRLREKPLSKELKVEKVASTSLDAFKHAPSREANKQTRGVKRLCQLVQVQKRRLREVYEKLNGTAKFCKQSMEKETINSKADNSLEQFLNNVNKENMQGYLTFCDMVATKEMENLSSVLPISSSVDRSVMDGHMKLIRPTLDTPLVDYATENPVVNKISRSYLNSTVEDVSNDILILDDKLYRRGKGQERFATMALPSNRRLTIADPSRIRRDEQPVHSTPLANKTMTYLNKSRNQTRMMRQFGTSRLPLDRLTNLQPKEMPRCDSNLSRRADGDLSMFICQRKPAFSRQKEKCKYFWENSYVSDSDDSLDHTLLGKELDDAVLNTLDDDRNVSTHSGSSLNYLSRRILPNDRDSFMLTFNSFSHVDDVQEGSLDNLNIANFKMKLVNYSLSDSDISSMSCENVGMSCDCNKTPCATFTCDYVKRFGYSPESGHGPCLSTFRKWLPNYQIIVVTSICRLSPYSARLNH